MSAAVIVRHLLEGTEDDPLGIGPLDHYAGPIEFDTDVKDILEHARFLKSQAEQAGALNPHVVGDINSHNLNRAFLRLACEELDDEQQVDLAIKRLRRAMHSMWK